MKEFTIHRSLLKELLKDFGEKKLNPKGRIGLTEAMASNEIGKYVSKSKQ